MSSDERKIGDLTVQVERDGCISSGNCIKVAPDLFEFDDESIAVFAKTADDASRDQVIEACEVCPVDALSIPQPDGKKPILDTARCIGCCCCLKRRQLFILSCEIDRLRRC